MNSQMLTFNWRKKMPMVMQAQASECGIACMTMLCQYYDKHVTLRDLRLRLPTGQQGCSLQDLIKVSTELGFSSRAVKLELGEIKQLSLPAILHWEFTHFVVLHKISKLHVYIHDPAVGERKLSWHIINDAFTGIALEVEPTQNFQKLPKQKPLRLWDFVKSIIGIKRQLLLLISLSLLIQIFALLSPFYMQTVIDKVLLSATDSLLLVLALGFTLILCIEVLCTYLRDVAVLRLSHFFNTYISSSVFLHLLKLPTNYFQSRHMGDIVSRFASLQAIRDFLTKGVVSAIIDGLLSIITLVVLFIYSWKLASFVLAFIMIYSLLRWFLFYPVKKLNQEILHSQAKEQSFFMQSIRAIRTMKLANTQDTTHVKWMNLFVDNNNLRIKLGQWDIAFSTVNKCLFGLENIVIIYLIANLVLAQQFTIGMMFAFCSYKGRFIGACASLIENFIEYKILNVHLHRLEDIILEEAECLRESQLILTNNPLADEDKVFTKESNPKLVVKDLSYCYSGSNEFLFNDLNLQVQKGDCVAIVGQSGCGKSTFLHCLLGLCVPSSGTVSVDACILRPNNRHQFNTAAVMQDDQLLNGSVLDNICQFSEHIDIDKAVKAAKSACIHQDIMAMSMQYQTLIGDMGSVLSGGQKQRLLLARAIYQSPDLMILDEATSHLDLQTESQVCENLKTLNTTIIMVAHRPQSIALANKVFSLSSFGLTEISYSNGNFQSNNNVEDNLYAK